MAAKKLHLNELNSLEDTHFQIIFKNVVELCPEAAIQVSKNLPFATTSALIECFHKYLDDLTLEEKKRILYLHPDLAGNLTEAGALSEESAREQKTSGLTSLPRKQKEEINYLNEKYKDKFEFPFVICVRENKLDAIFKGLKERLNHSCEEEVKIGIEEVKKICRLRILEILSE